MLLSPQILARRSKGIVAAAGSVLFDVSAFTLPSGTGVTTYSTSSAFNTALNLGSGANGTTNRALIVAVMFAQHAAGTVSGVTCTRNSVSLTQIGSPIGNGNAGDIYFFGLTNPDLGSIVTVFNWTGADQAIVAGLAVVGADQTGGTTTFRNATTNTGNSTTAGVTVTSAVGDIVFAAYTAVGNFTSGSGTDIGHNNTGNLAAAASNWDAGTASVSPTYSVGSGVWAAAGVSIKSA